jgi:glycosyltransferase involved in cell wall biosynthesis
MTVAKVLRMPKLNSRGRLLFVAYPLLPVSDQSAGGAEQVLTTLERVAAKSGWRTTVAACNGSTAAGQLYATMPPGGGRLSSARHLESQHCKRVAELISVRSAIGTPFDLVHDHSGSFFAHASRIDAPVLATMHLPRSFYPAQWFHHLPQNVYLNCVSKAQARTFADVPNMIGVVPNGIGLNRFPLRSRKQDYLLWMGRICEEKGTHTALDVAKRTGLPIVMIGQVYPFAYHQNYFDREIRPRMDRMGEQVKYIERPSFADKIKLIQNARALLVTSSAEETSCLVAMEAAACGTPVVAMRRGAFSEVVQHGETGYIVSDVSEMSAALAHLSAIKPRSCRAYAQRHFSAQQMLSGYEALYKRIHAQRAPEAAPALTPVFAA